MGGVIAPAKKHRLVTEHSFIPEPEKVFVEKVVPCPKAEAQVLTLRGEIDKLRSQLKEEGDRCTLLHQKLAEKPKEVLKTTSVVKVVEKPVEVIKEVQKAIPVRIVAACLASSFVAGLIVGWLI